MCDLNSVVFWELPAVGGNKMAIFLVAIIGQYATCTCKYEVLQFIVCDERQVR